MITLFLVLPLALALTLAYAEAALFPRLVLQNLKLAGSPIAVHLIALGNGCRAGSSSDERHGRVQVRTALLRHRRSRRTTRLTQNTVCCLLQWLDGTEG